MRGHNLGLEIRGSGFAGYAGTHQREKMGEYVLVEAVLWQAVHEYQKLAQSRTRRELRRFQELDEWFLVDDVKWDFSFVNLCEILDIEPSYVRAALKRWRERQPTHGDEVRSGASDRSNVKRPTRHSAGTKIAPHSRLFARI